MADQHLKYTIEIDLLHMDGQKHETVQDIEVALVDNLFCEVLSVTPTPEAPLTHVATMLENGIHWQAQGMRLPAGTRLYAHGDTVPHVSTYQHYDDEYTERTGGDDMLENVQSLLRQRAKKKGK